MLEPQHVAQLLSSAGAWSRARYHAMANPDALPLDLAIGRGREELCIFAQSLRPLGIGCLCFHPGTQRWTNFDIIIQSIPGGDDARGDAASGRPDHGTAWPHYETSDSGAEGLNTLPHSPSVPSGASTPPPDMP